MLCYVMLCLCSPASTVTATTTINKSTSRNVIIDLEYDAILSGVIFQSKKYEKIVMNMRGYTYRT